MKCTVIGSYLQLFPAKDSSNTLTFLKSIHAHSSLTGFLKSYPLIFRLAKLVKGETYTTGLSDYMITLV